MYSDIGMMIVEDNRVAKIEVIENADIATGTKLRISETRTFVNEFTPKPHFHEDSRDS